MEKDDMKRLILAFAITAVVLFGFDAFFPKKRIPVSDETPITTETKKTEEKANSVAITPSVSENSVTENTKETIVPINAAVDVFKNDKISRRIKIDTPNLSGSIRLIGGRIDDLRLKKYTESVDDDTLITLLSPESSKNPYFIDLGYTSQNNEIDAPNDATFWEAKGEVLSIGKPLILSYKNAKGMVFTRTFSIDDGYMITVADKIENNTKEQITLFPYGLISQTGLKEVGKASGHEGFVAYLGSKLEEITYADILKKGQISYTSTGGWAGFGEKYWLTSLIFDQNSKETTINTLSHKNKDVDVFQTDFMLSPQQINGESSAYFKTFVFAGAKEVALLDKYTTELNVPHMDLAIDFGWYYFLTKPFLYILKFFYELLGNMGLSILVCAFLLRMIMFPIASKSFESMKKMKKLHPLINEINQKYAGDQVRINQEIMAVYKKENVNPAAGCLPMFIQIPIFFSLYKVLYIAIEMRQAPFYWWIHDLSVKDPTSILTLFGTINWNVPEFLNIGIWPLIMGVTMFIQQQLNPAPNDKTQAKVFMFLPIMFTFMLSNFASGLVIYWAWSNILSIIQQKLIYLKMEKKDNGSNS